MCVSVDNTHTIPPIASELARNIVRGSGICVVFIVFQRLVELLPLAAAE